MSKFSNSFTDGRNYHPDHWRTVTASSSPVCGYDDRVLEVSGVPFIFWSVDPLDWRDPRRGNRGCENHRFAARAIILAHDIHETTVDAVPAIIVALKNRGIQFVTVTKLFEPQELLPGYSIHNNLMRPTK